MKNNTHPLLITLDGFSPEAIVCSFFKTLDNNAISSKNYLAGAVEFKRKDKADWFKNWTE